MKNDLKLLYGSGLVVFCIAFLTALLLRPPASSPSGTPLDIAFLAWAVAIFLPSLVLIVVNNFIFLGQKKDWRDFWTTDVFEYFYTPNISEKWRIARGRFILFAITLPSVFLAIWLYSAFK